MATKVTRKKYINPEDLSKEELVSLITKIFEQDYVSDNEDPVVEAVGNFLYRKEKEEEARLDKIRIALKKSAVSKLTVDECKVLGILR